MSEPRFFAAPAPISIEALLALTGARCPLSPVPDKAVQAVAPIERAGPGDLTFLENTAYIALAGQTKASACLVNPRLADKLAQGTIPLVVDQPYKAFALVAAQLYPEAMRPQPVFSAKGISPGAIIHPEAVLEANVTVDPGAVIGKGAEIGAGSIIGATAVIGPGVRIGRDSAIGPGATVQHALVGNRVIIHAGARIGQDGFGFAMGPGGHLKVPQIGRVIIQDDVEIGANTCIDRGSNRDTVIGEGTKIDNLVQIGHNVTIGRHCVIVSQVGISGSTTLEDYVVLGGQVGIVGHLTIGMGAQIAGSSNVKDDVPRGAKWGGTPAKPIKEWFREMSWVKKMAQRPAKSGGAETDGE